MAFCFLKYAVGESDVGDVICECGVSVVCVRVCERGSGGVFCSGFVSLPVLVRSRRTEGHPISPKPLVIRARFTEEPRTVQPNNESNHTICKL